MAQGQVTAMQFAAHLKCVIVASLAVARKLQLRHGDMQVHN